MVIDGHLMVISPNVIGHFVNLKLCFKRTFTEINKSADGTKSQCWVTIDPREASLSCQVSWFRETGFSYWLLYYYIRFQHVI